VLSSEVALAGIESIRLIDRHRHGLVTTDLDLASFERLLTESRDPPPASTSQFDSPLGLAVRRWCAPLVGLEPFASPEEYLSRRREMGPKRSRARSSDKPASTRC
jgi:uncharacterized protein